MMLKVLILCLPLAFAVRIACDECQTWTDWSKCDSGASTSRTCTDPDFPDCKQERRCTKCDYCDLWVPPSSPFRQNLCSKLGEVVVWQCQSRDPELAQCTQERTCNCNDCTEWIHGIHCNGYTDFSEKMCRWQGWEECFVREPCPEMGSGNKPVHAEVQATETDSPMKKEIHAEVQATCDECTLWGPWSQCDGLIDTSTRRCLSHPSFPIPGVCTQSRRCSCNDCQMWTDWRKCDGTTGTTSRTCTDTGFPDCKQERRCTECDYCDTWVPPPNPLRLRLCSRPGDVVVWQCQSRDPKLAQCTRERTCTCDDCTEWIIGIHCNQWSNFTERMCRWQGWEKCVVKEPCPPQPWNKRIHAEVQSKDSSTHSELVSRQSSTNNVLGGFQMIFVVSVFCGFLLLAALVIFVVVRYRRQSSPPLVAAEEELNIL